MLKEMSENRYVCVGGADEYNAAVLGFLQRSRLEKGFPNEK